MWLVITVSVLLVAGTIYLVGDENWTTTLAVALTLVGLSFGSLFLAGALNHPDKRAVLKQRQLGTGIRPNPACGTSQPDNGPC